MQGECADGGGFAHLSGTVEQEPIGRRAEEIFLPRIRFDPSGPEDYARIGHPGRDKIDSRMPQRFFPGAIGKKIPWVVGLLCVPGKPGPEFEGFSAHEPMVKRPITQVQGQSGRVLVRFWRIV